MQSISGITILTSRLHCITCPACASRACPFRTSCAMASLSVSGVLRPSRKRPRGKSALPTPASSKLAALFDLVYINRCVAVAAAGQVGSLNACRARSFQRPSCLVHTCSTPTRAEPGFPSASVSAEKMCRAMALSPTTVTLGSDKVIDL